MSQPQPIMPTIGRVVLLHVDEWAHPLPVLITVVHGSRCINVGGFDGNGNALVDPPTSVTLVQPADDVPATKPYCTWMPYQVKKSTGSESGEPSVGTEKI